MNKLLSGFVAILMMCFASTGFAGGVLSNALTIKHIEGRENITVYFNESLPNPGGCSQGALNTVSWEGTNPAAKNFMSFLLVAKASGRSVQVWVDDSVCLWGGWPNLVSVRVL